MSSAEPTSLSGVRADVWLWAARMFKTRSLSKQAIEGGKVDVNGLGCKPAKTVHVGDVVKVSRGEDLLVLTVLGLSETRGPAPVAQLLYQESAESIATKAARREQNRLEGEDESGRPDKRERRQLIEFKEGE